MARLIRRRSMERLELYDLDKFSTINSINYQLPPPLPPPRIPHTHRRPSINPTLERYQFLCNMARSKIDPIYAATPMFTTIPSTSKEKPHRQLLGSYIRLENVKPLSENTPKSPEPKKAETINDMKEEEEEEKEEGKENEKTKDDKDNKENDDDQFSSSSSSSNDSDNEEKKVGDGGEDDDHTHDGDDEEKKVGGGGGGGEGNDHDHDGDVNKKEVVEEIFNRDKKD